MSVKAFSSALPKDRDVILCECFGRDGLQHEPLMLSVAHKVALLSRFADIGFQRIEATSYSNPAVIPQFGDASEVLKALPRKDDVFYKATCANVRAIERALADQAKGFGANEVSLLVSASESHSRKNLARSRQDQWANIAAMVAACKGRFRFIGTISMAFGCPFEGQIPVDSVMRDVARFGQLGVGYVALGDTIGVATPKTTSALFKRMREEFPNVEAIAHFHDTRGTGLLNYAAALSAGVRYFDCAFGGTGGHPVKVKYGGGNTGNVCTEDLVDLFHSLGVRTGIDMDELISVALECEAVLGRELQGRVTRSGLNPLYRVAQDSTFPGSGNPPPFVFN